MPTISVNITVGADDGNEFINSSLSSFFTYAATYAKVDQPGPFNARHVGAFRFQSVTVPQAATISTANITFIKKSGSGSPVINIYGSNVNNAAAWGPGNRVDNITKTAASTVLDVSSATSVNNITAIVQAIINRAGWVSGNALAFGLFAATTSANTWQCFTFEKGAPNIPNLSITYSAAVISRIQSTHSNFAVAASSGSLTLGASPTNGNALILTMGGNGDTLTTAGAITSISQTGATWLKAKDIHFDDTIRTTNAEIWYALNVSGAGTGITVNFSTGGEGGALCVAEYNGIAASSAVDKTASNSGALGSPNPIDSGTTATTTQADELWIASLAQPQISPNTFSSPTNGFSIVAQDNVNFGAGAMLEKIVTSTGAANAGVSSTSTTFEQAGCIATFFHTIPSVTNSNFFAFF